MPKAKDTEYRDRTATAERTEYRDRTATAERTEYRDRTAIAEKTEYHDRTATAERTDYRDRTAIAEKTEYHDRTAVAEKAEFTDEKAEHKTQYPAENRDNSYLAANQHMVKFADELRGINEQAALSFDRRKNPAEYDLKEKQEMLEAVTEAFNAANWNSANERRLAADDIAQNLYHPMYPRVEIADAAVQHKLPGEFIQELKQEKIEYFEQSPSKERTFYGGAKNRLTVTKRMLKYLSSGGGHPSGREVREPQRSCRSKPGEERPAESRHGKPAGGAPAGVLGTDNHNCERGYRL